MRSIPILVLSFNKPELTARSLRSALRHSENVFLVHNGSLQKHVETLKTQFREVSHLELTTNRGFSGGMNFGLTHVLQSSPWAFALTNDCELLTSLSVPKSGSAQLIAPLIWSRKRGRIDSSLGIVNFKTASLRHHRGLGRPPELRHFEKIYTPGSAFLIHRDLFLKTSGFDEGLGTYWEDVDLSLRLSSEEMAADNSIEVLHGVGKTCHQDPHYTTYQFQRNRLRVLRRHCPPGQRVRLEFSLLTNQSLLALRFLRKRKFPQLRLLLKARQDA